MITNTWRIGGSLDETVSVYVSVASGLIPLEASMEKLDDPLSGAVPERVAVPLPLLAKWTPKGSAPVSVMAVATGLALVTILKLNATSTLALAVFLPLKTGAESGLAPTAAVGAYWTKSAAAPDSAAAMANLRTTLALCICSPCCWPRSCRCPGQRIGLARRDPASDR